MVGAHSPDCAGPASKNDALRRNQRPLPPHSSDKLPIGDTGSNKKGIVTGHKVANFINMVELQTGLNTSLTFIV